MMILGDLFKRKSPAEDKSAPTGADKKIKYAVGYQLPDEVMEGSCVDMLAKYRDYISEVYFALPMDSSGRAPMGAQLKDVDPRKIIQVFNSDLERLREMGIPGVLLFNASCYGAHAGSYALMEHVTQGIEEVRKHIDVHAITTTSLNVAAHVKKTFPGLPVRSSINMLLGTIRQMEFVSDYFDGYYLHRDYNRDLKHIAQVRKWCDAHGKTLHMLVNSGCIYQCPSQMFHLNIVSHIMEMMRVPSPQPSFPILCMDTFSKPENWYKILQNTWIRPEDIHNYVGMFDTFKLALRRTIEPEAVLKAYSAQKWDGNFLDITEPGHAGLPNIPIFNNSKFPDDWFAHTTSCGHHCETCSYCKEVFEKIREKK